MRDHLPRDGTAPRHFRHRGRGGGGSSSRPATTCSFLVVAGDIREHVKATFAELLDRIKAEAVIKQEYHEA